MFENAKPNFQKGGKFSFLGSTFDAFETFAFVPGHTTQKGVHIRDGIDLKRTMFVVVTALIPCLLFGMWNVGYQHHLATGEVATLMDNFLYGLAKVLPIVVVAYGVGLGIEFAFCQINGHQVNEGYLVSGMLIPLVLPPSIPLWMVALATAFAVIVGKEVFGGTGMNLLNPALTARVFLFFAYPGYMSGVSLSSGQYVWTDVMKDNLANGVDGFSGATVLGKVAENTQIQDAGWSFWDFFFGTIPGSIGETSTLMILIGALILFVTGIGSWRIMLSVFIGGAIGALILNGAHDALGVTAENSKISALMQIPFYYHWVIGGFAFGAVYMATDPVTASQTQKGKWIYGLLIGFLAVIIRVFNPSYPEGMMLAILLMNVFAPLIDYYVVDANKKRRLNRAKI